MISAGATGILKMAKRASAWRACSVLPEVGRRVRQMNETLAGLLPVQGGRIMHWHPETTKTLPWF